jgi:tetratricopeptide (TPR) repeat protein
MDDSILNRTLKEFLSKVLLVGVVAATVLAPPARGQFPVPDDEERILILRSRWLRNPGDYSLADELAQLLFNTGRREEACRLLQSAHGGAVSDAQRRRLESRIRVLARGFRSADASKEYQSAVLSLSGGKYDAAEARLNRVLTAEPNHFDALTRRGQARWLLGNIDGAFEDFSQARWVHPFELELQLWLGLSHLRRGERRQGLLTIQDALRRGDSDQRRQPFWRAAQILSQWESGKSLGSGSGLRELVVSDQVPSWLLEEMLRGPVLEATPVAIARQALGRRPEASLDTDGSSGISLQIWLPERLLQRLRELDAEQAPTPPPGPRPTA